MLRLPLGLVHFSSWTKRRRSSWNTQTCAQIRSSLIRLFLLLLPFQEDGDVVTIANDATLYAAIVETQRRSKPLRLQLSLRGVSASASASANAAGAIVSPGPSDEYTDNGDDGELVEAESVAGDAIAERTGSDVGAKRVESGDSGGNDLILFWDYENISMKADYSSTATMQALRQFCAKFSASFTCEVCWPALH